MKRKFGNIGADNGVQQSKKKQKRSAEKTDTQRIVSDINAEGFAESRSVEIQALTEVVRSNGSNHMAFQKLPRHMRRRAMSHNIKRVPRRLHQAVKTELEKTKPPGKRPSRKYRRRPRNLLAEYERRKRKVGWLETHIWHAKRFKMVEKWNYKLGLHPNEKSIRACFRAVNKNCLMQDVSYENYIEVHGPRQIILDGLAHLTSENTGLTFASRMTGCGTRQGQLMLFSYDGYPYNPVGPVTFLWQPQVSHPATGQSDSTLWICCHPSFYSQALNEISKCFGKVLDVNESHSTSCKKEDQIEDKGQVRVTSLKDQLVKFRLYGPASHHILAEVLKIANVQVQEVNNSNLEQVRLVTEINQVNEVMPKEVKASGQGQGEDDSTHGLFWWKEFYCQTVDRTQLLQQQAAWSRVQRCQSPAEVPSGCVLSLTVRDPRLLLPPKRNRVLAADCESLAAVFPTEIVTPGVSSSPLWDAAIRHQVTASRVPEQKLNEMRSQLLIPGSSLQLGQRESLVPVMLIQRPGTNSSTSRPGYASGWDILLPSGWGMAFWVALVYRGARVGGIRESQSVALLAGALCEPFDLPDTRAGQEQLESEAQTLQGRHDRRPPAKRPNYTKLGFLRPFHMDFLRLVNEWRGKSQVLLEKLQIPLQHDEKMYVLRDRKCLRLLQTAVSDPRLLPRAKGKVPGKPSKTANVLVQISTLDVGKEILSRHLSSVVPVLLTVDQRGVPAFGGHICLPSVEDLDKLANKSLKFGGPLEEKHPDTEAPIRKEERRIRKLLRKKKKRGKGKNKEVSKSVPVQSPAGPRLCQPPVDSQVEPQPTPASQSQAVADLNTADSSRTLIDHTSRSVCGFVRAGNFDFGKGHGTGLGFCSTAALMHLIEQQGGRKPVLVLVRNLTSLQYRFASLSVIL